MVMNDSNTKGQPHASQQPATNGTRSASKSSSATLLVGTFRSPALYTLTFESAAASCGTDTTITTTTIFSPPSLSVSHKSAVVGGHSWLALSPSKTNLYTTCWTSPPTVAAYAIHPGDKSVTLLNTAPVASLSGYVAVTPSGRHLISVGGPTGEVFRLVDDDEPGPSAAPGEPTATAIRRKGREGGGKIGPLVQTLNFREGGGADDGKREGVAHGGFGGLRWGSHSVDVAPDGRSVYVADIGHNCIWTYRLNEEEYDSNDKDNDKNKELLTLGTKHISPRGHDGPRHAWPHPSGRVLYVVQEHSSMVDAFAVADDGVTLAHLEGYTILPGDKKCEDFWADEVRTSHLFSYDDDDNDAPNNSSSPPSTTTTTTTRRPRYLYGSTRGLHPETKGYVAAYQLDPEGRIQGPAVHIYETRTSGGLANAIEPAPAEVSRRIGGEEKEEEEEFIALTDSEEGWVVILGWNGKRFREVAATRLGDEEEDREGREVVQAATAVWL